MLPLSLRVGSVAAILLALTIGHAFADVQIKLSPKELHGYAERIVRGKISSVRSEWNPDRTFIFTYATVAVERYHKGSGPAAFEIRVPGGKVGSYSITADSMPRFEQGDDVLVFLGRWNDGAIRVEGYTQGVSRVVSSPKGPMLRGGALDGRSMSEAAKELGLR